MIFEASLSVSYKYVGGIMALYVLSDNVNFTLVLGCGTAVIIIDLAAGKSAGGLKFQCRS